MNISAIVTSILTLLPITTGRDFSFSLYVFGFSVSQGKYHFVMRFFKQKLELL
jgi:hypothetical protein